MQLNDTNSPRAWSKEIDKKKREKERWLSWGCILFSFEGTIIKTKKGQKSSKSFKKVLDKHMKMWYNNYVVERQHKEKNSVAIAKRNHLFSCRTQKLSSLTPMILGGWLPGKVGSCWNIWPVGQEVKTRPFHGCNASSILARVTILNKPFNVKGLFL